MEEGLRIGEIEYVVGRARINFIKKRKEVGKDARNKQWAVLLS